MYIIGVQVLFIMAFSLIKAGFYGFRSASVRGIGVLGK
jgi:hypothetical protein